ncbi:Methylphosphotriester-DNA--protein-cysteine S-methyltransferase (EC 2.1.1.n11) / DNA-3-methyladenine glycosylase II [hydrothermal vent metagenome]|uniref:Methylphosphotriester-DNA--protein-cysteine S-methyltransferase / DNA-3-methyladenine glycosylase II n=1 Tax=hydrothermal vent metagenome TaxID=652676 RepID=A0A3B1AR23_9ZZZZ
MNLDHDACYRAIVTRDARFDGRLYIGVRTTGIYCRPICPARTPKRENVSFYPTAAAAQEAGFRPCLRCRPENSPDLAAWNGTSNTVKRALALIGEGALDDETVDHLAEQLGVGERHLRRLFQQHLGASPIAVAQTRRILFAKQLIMETRMPMTEIAHAAGFGSIRRFNAVFQALYKRPPGALRRTRQNAHRDVSVSDIVLTMSYAAPYAWPSMISFLQARAIPGVEWVDQQDRYHRSIALDGCQGSVRVAFDENKKCLRATIRFPRISSLAVIVSRLRRMFDLTADPTAIDTHLANDPRLAPLIAARPGLRVPGAWDGFELGIRAILGQQISVAAATTLAGKLVSLYGEPLESSLRSEGLKYIFPSPKRLAGTDLRSLGMPGTRARALSALSEAALETPNMFSASQAPDATLERLKTLPGVGDWTSQYILMRALCEPDAFPAADIGLMRAMASKEGQRPTPATLLQHAEAWRPWRAYATLHLWASEGNTSATDICTTKEKITHAATLIP